MGKHWAIGNVLSSDNLNETGASIVSPTAGENITLGDAVFIEMYERFEVGSTKSTWVNQSSPTTNYGSSSVMSTFGGGGNEQSGLIEFDLTGFPSSANTIKAFLELTSSEVLDSKSFSVANLTTSWVEGTVTWNTIPTAGGVTATLFRIPAEYYNKGKTAITSIYEYWQDTNNYGLKLTSTTTVSSKDFDSDDGTVPPRLVVYGSENRGKVFTSYQEGRTFLGYAAETATSGNPVRVETTGIFSWNTGLTEGINDTYQDTYAGYALSATEILVKKGRFEIADEGTTTMDAGASVTHEIIPPHATSMEITFRTVLVGSIYRKFNISTKVGETHYLADYKSTSLVVMKVQTIAGSDGFNIVEITESSDLSTAGDVRVQFFGEAA